MGLVDGVVEKGEIGRGLKLDCFSRRDSFWGDARKLDAK